MTTVKNNVSVHKEQPSIGYNPNVIRVGMKLIETYRETSLFEEFRVADVDKDGIISEKEYELYDKKEKLKNEYNNNFQKAYKFDKKKHGIPLGVASLLGTVAIATKLGTAGALSTFLVSVGTIATPILGALALGAVIYAVTNVVKTSMEQEEKRAVLNEQIQRLNEEYKKLMTINN